MKFLNIVLFMCLVIPSHAQVKGTVKDAKGDPIFMANVYWASATKGTSTAEDGSFSIKKLPESNILIASFIGYVNDTIIVKSRNVTVNFVLKEGVMLEESSVVANRLGLMKIRSSVMNEEMISSTELLRAACCNLGESFTTNPSVDVSYSDAATGAKQIRLLGLSGTYVQMLTENFPNYRGAAAPFSLGYVPGPWMQSIQVSKGSSSVKNGYESIAGQINIEFKKPQVPENNLNLNVFANHKERYEGNIDGNVHINKRLSTSILAHYENETQTHDDNGDGFLDMPRVEQYNVQNRWAWMGDHYVFQAGIKVLQEDRSSGQSAHSHGGSAPPEGELYTIGLKTKRYEAFTKNAYIFDKEKSTNIALILSGSIHQLDATYGHKFYDVNQKNFYASLMFESNITKEHNISTGLSLNHDYYDQDYRLTNNAEDREMTSKEKETVPGAYVQYTFNWNEKLVLMGGIRADHSSEYGFFVTPRAHVKYNPNDIIHFRLSAGKGYRTNHVLAENNFLLASGRKVIIDEHLKQEEAWNYGVSVATYIPLFWHTLNINAEYYYTRFRNQLVVDLDSDPHQVHFANLDGKSYSHTFQVEVNYPFFRGFNLMGAYRLTDVQTTFNRKLMKKPLVGRYKALLTATYKTPMDLWQFDVTLQFNGGGRMPTPYQLGDGTDSWERNYHSYRQLSAQVSRFFKHWSVYIGGENMTNFKQKNPIIGAEHPWSDHFDSTMIWGPVHGSIYYMGVRVNL